MTALQYSYTVMGIDKILFRSILASHYLAGGMKMPPIFKSLASIMAWGLWIIAWVMGMSTFIMGIVNGTLYGDEPAPMVFPVFFAVSIACGVSAVVVMLLRKKMD